MRLITPGKAIPVEPLARQPQTKAIVHQHLHAVAAGIGKPVSVMRVSRAKDLHRPRQGFVKAGAQLSGDDPFCSEVRSDFRETRPDQDDDEQVQEAHAARAISLEEMDDFCDFHAETPTYGVGRVVNQFVSSIAS